jgi:transcriptional regulator with XRE-family HTH domain
VSGPRPFATLLGDLRRTAGLTQQELADRANIGVRTLRDLETGRAIRPQRSTIDLLAAALDLAGPDRTGFLEAARGRLPLPAPTTTDTAPRPPRPRPSSP